MPCCIWAVTIYAVVLIQFGFKDLCNLDRLFKLPPKPLELGP